MIFECAPLDEIGGYSGSATVYLINLPASSTPRFNCFVASMLLLYGKDEKGLVNQEEPKE